MSKPLTLEDLDDQVRPHIYTQKYGTKSLIEDVKIIPLRHHTGEEGDFVELMCPAKADSWLVFGIFGRSLKRATIRID
ncbi:hypothetical protein HYV22_02625 [Candidatus Gottesmanbacteria bacterium]|nr:hypothetical protein [Candidatus Gottesmanbacteria bacterium]